MLRIAIVSNVWQIFVLRSTKRCSLNAYLLVSADKRRNTRPDRLKAEAERNVLLSAWNFNDVFGGM